MTIDPRIPTIPGRSPSGFHQPGRLRGAEGGLNSTHGHIWRSGGTTPAWYIHNFNEGVSFSDFDGANKTKDPIRVP